LYKKALFLIVVKNDPQAMLTTDSRGKQLDREHRIFFLRIKITSYHKQHQAKTFTVNETYFFCPFCSLGFVRLNSTDVLRFSLKLDYFQKIRKLDFTTRHYQVYSENYIKNSEFCQQQSVMHLYKRDAICLNHHLLSELIVFASKSNVTLKLFSGPQFDFPKIPQIFGKIHSTNVKSLNTYWSTVLRMFEYPSIIYCFDLGRVTVAEANMWTKYVPFDIWGLLGLCFLLLAILNTAKKCSESSPKFILQNVIMFVNSFLKFMRIIWRQSLIHKWKLLGVLELFFSILISVYENSITANVVVPLVPKPFLSTEELYNNNYTFAVQTDFSSRIYDFLSDEYNTVNHRRVSVVDGFWYLAEFLEMYFLNHNTKTKYAIVGELSKHGHFRAVTLAKENKGTCYHIYPTEGAFYPEPVYFTFASAEASSFNKGISLLQTHGFVQAFDNANNFRESVFAVDVSRRFSAKHGYEVTTYKDLKNSRLKESMITLGNIKSVLYVGLALIICACLDFVAEVCTKEIYFMMLP